MCTSCPERTPKSIEFGLIVLHTLQYRRHWQDGAVGLYCETYSVVRDANNIVVSNTDVRT